MTPIHIPRLTYMLCLTGIACIAILHESDILSAGYLQTDAQITYIIQLSCIVLTLGSCWATFRKKRSAVSVSNCVLRILRIAIPMLINLEIYYALLGNQSVLYCFLITLVSFIFCWPSDRKTESEEN